MSTTISLNSDSTFILNFNSDKQICVKISVKIKITVSENRAFFSHYNESKEVEKKNEFAKWI